MLGQAVGGAGALYLVKYIGFSNTYFFVAAAILAVTLLVVLPLQEPVVARVRRGRCRAAAHAAPKIRLFVQRGLGRVHRVARIAGRPGVCQSCPPVPWRWACRCSIRWRWIWASMTIASRHSICGRWWCLRSAAWWAAGFRIALGRRRALGWFIFSMSPITLWLAWALWHAGWIHPVDPAHRAGLIVPPWLVTVFWLSSLLYWFANGLMYGARAALFMDVSNPRVAATQFTAYMALLNLGIAYSAKWQGWAVDRYGYPQTLLADALFGLVCLVFLAAMGTIRAQKSAAPSARVD